MQHLHGGVTMDPSIIYLYYIAAASAIVNIGKQ